ncbi:MAG: 16S rRNA (cytidine(1402)-2'-O)-methyltransferase [Candidatus Dormibacteria bacterium]
MSHGTLAVVPTPIGNLEDITLRALRVLRDCDAVVAEDSRRTRSLLTAHGISRPVISLPAHAERARVPALLSRLDAGESLALCTDAGTPAVSDPGSVLVRAARAAGYSVTSLPGASAVTTAVAGSGVGGGGGFCFLGFPPRTPGKLRRTLAGALATGLPVVFFEASPRLARTLRLLVDLVGEREVVVGRELSKLHESYYAGTAAELSAAFLATPPRGECTVVVAPGVAVPLPAAAQAADPGLVGW